MTIPAALPITTLYSGILGVAFALLTLRVGVTRAGSGELYGSKPGTYLYRLVRSAGTVGELGFPGLFLIGLLEYQSIISPGLLWWIGLVFTVTRLAHSIQLGHPQTVPNAVRVVSFLATIAVYVLTSAILLFGSHKN